jgi:hypothetical protein
MDMKEIVLKLVGPIVPIGETNEDDRRFDNLKVLCLLVDALVSDIDDVGYRNKDRGEYSMKRAGEYASNFLSKTLNISE